MTLQVEISKQQSEQIISAIQLLRGVKSVKCEKKVTKKVKYKTQKTNKGKK